MDVNGAIGDHFSQINVSFFSPIFVCVFFVLRGVIKSSRVQYWGVFPSFFRFAVRDPRKIKQKSMRNACAFKTIILANCV